MNNVIATIRLAPGQVGYYDELSRIHLTMGNPQTAVYAGTNVTQLRKSVKSGRLLLLNGTFGEEKHPYKLVKQGRRYVIAKNDAVEEEAKSTPIIKAEAPAKEVKVEAEETPAVEEIKAEEPAPAVEEAPVAIEEASTEEDTPKKKKATRKKKSDKTE